jgi:ABC-type sugar transport system permease subunit
MKKSTKWKISSFIILVLFFGLIYQKLVSNISDNQKEKYTIENAQIIINSLSKDLEKNGFNLSKNQDFLQKVKNDQKNINEISIVLGRKYFVSTSKNLTAKKISKNIFDVQKKMKFDFRKTKNIALKSIVKKGKYSFYKPIVINGKFKGLVIIQSTQESFFDVNISQTFMFFALIILIGLLILMEIYLPRYQIIIGIVLFAVTILLINNNIGHQLQKNINTWTVYKQNIAENFTSRLGITNQISLPETEISIPQSVKIWNISFILIGTIFLLLVYLRVVQRFFETLYEYREAYFYILPAMTGVFLLVFFPFIYGILIGFTDYNLTNFSTNLVSYFTNFSNYTFSNFINILKVFNLHDYDNFYFTLIHTVVWTVLNLFFHVTIGVALALILNNPKLKGRTFFRILLILPWAIPNYITSLIWKGMFHKQFGAINGLLQALGFQPISWFTHAPTAFLANLVTNVWLGFPFMMIIALGALQSIPKELYEASAIDGSTKWQSFWTVTVPLLRPAMIPAIILGTIWTFNQFNVIYLVSGGGPDGATELLITDAYKMAFEQYRYGYAAAYCIIIFIILLGYGSFTSKISKATQGAYE